MLTYISYLTYMATIPQPKPGSDEGPACCHSPTDSAVESDVGADKDSLRDLLKWYLCAGDICKV